MSCAKILGAVIDELQSVCRQPSLTTKVSPKPGRGLRPKLPHGPHVLDRDHPLKAALQAQDLDQPLCISAGRIREQPATPLQSLNPSTQASHHPNMLVKVTEWMRLSQKNLSIHTMVAHQTE
jgi:hypothetical protein